MPRTRFSLEEPLPYEDQLEFLDKTELIQHIINVEEIASQLDQTVQACAKRIEDLEAHDSTEGQAEALRQRDRTIQTLEQRNKNLAEAVDTLRRRLDEADAHKQQLTTQIAMLERLTDQLRQQPGGEPELDEEDRQQIQAALRILTSGGFPRAPYYLTAAQRQSFAHTIRRVLHLDED